MSRRTKLVRVYEEDYNILLAIVEALTKQWKRNATFADAVRHQKEIKPKK